MTQRIAWTPLRSPEKIRVVGILCPPGQIMCRSVYNSFLGDRIQALVDGSDDPEHVAWTSKEALHDAGMWGYDSYGSLSDIGSNLVADNPSVWEALTNLRVYDSIYPPRRISHADSLLVRRELRGEWSNCDDPEGKIQIWAYGLSRAL